MQQTEPELKGNPPKKGLQGLFKSNDSKSKTLQEIETAWISDPKDAFISFGVHTGYSDDRRLNVCTVHCKEIADWELKTLNSKDLDKYFQEA